MLRQLTFLLGLLMAMVIVLVFWACFLLWTFIFGPKWPSFHLKIWSYCFSFFCLFCKGKRPALFIAYFFIIVVLIGMVFLIIQQISHEMIHLIRIFVNFLSWFGLCQINISPIESNSTSLIHLRA